jgi:hypothetical protein
MRASRYPARTSTLAHSESSPKQPLPASRSTNWRYRSDQSVTIGVNACSISSCSHRVHMGQDRNCKEAVLGWGRRPAAHSHCPAHEASGHGQGLRLGGSCHSRARKPSIGVVCRQAPATVAGCTRDLCGGCSHLAALVSAAALLSCCGCCW